MSRKRFTTVATSSSSSTSIRSLNEKKWNVVVIGGDHNGLTTAAYLARAGVECGNTSYEDHGGHAGELIVLDEENENEREPIVLDEENEKESVVLDEENEMHNANDVEVDRGLVGPEDEDVWRNLRCTRLRYTTIWSSKTWNSKPPSKIWRNKSSL
ncbi:hypothetical protein LINPERHAP2_LOCUS14403 [Linum perenne]